MNQTETQDIPRTEYIIYIYIYQRSSSLFAISDHPFVLETILKLDKFYYGINQIKNFLIESL